MSAAVDRLLEVSLYAIVITGCILLFRLVFAKRLSPRLQYLLWTILIARLLMPVTVESGFHLPALLRVPAAVSAEAPMDTGEELTPVLEASPGHAAVAPPLQPAAPPAQTPARRTIPWRQVAFIVWAAGALVSLGCTVWLRLRFLGRLRRTQTPPSPVAALMLAGCREALGVKGRIELMATTQDLSPALAFIGGRNVLIMPAGLTDKYAMRYALLHELSHYRRGDQYMLLLMSLLRAVYWFNPVLYYAFSEMRADMETACDACVLAVIEPAEKRDYLLTLLALFNRRCEPSLGFAQVQTRRLAKKRMKGAFMTRKISLPAGIAALFLALVLLLGCFTTACQRGDATSPVSPGNAALATPGNASAEILNNDIIKVSDPSGYTRTYQVVDRGPASEQQNKLAPDSAAVSPTEAARNLLELMALVYDGQLGGGAVNAYFRSVEGQVMELYELYVGGREYADSYFWGLCDAATGEVLIVEDLRAHGELIDDPDAVSGWHEYFDDYDSEEIIGRSMTAARTLVEGRLAKGSTVLDDSYVDGVQATFRLEEPIVSEVYLHMDGGPCYSLGVYYPSMRIGHVHIYPLGWVYCRSGTFHTESLDNWALEELGLPTPAIMETPMPADPGEPMPTPSAMLKAVAADAELYTMVAQTAEAMIGDEFLAADFGLAAEPDFSNFGEICRAWLNDLLFDKMALPVAETGSAVGLASLDDPQLRPGMCVSYRIDNIDYAGVYLGDGQVAVLAKGEPYKLRRLDLAPFIESGSLTELCLLRLYEAA